ncbi:hypothetical protein IE53DRAFT_390102 [Violaceomyces palustris]|uniref:Uncharacterized protein n=1 Tax=Violaceomyces palustris TaxID=1673888 RepID=A0ACD0NPM1_9BASI|nr:hypothetical protein IE53DRAFT_390102 [Violaceomyces palustris]
MKGGALSKYDKVIPKSAVGGSSPPKRGLSVRSENDIASNRSKVEDPRKMDSPWGVFGARDEWRPLAPPSISRSGVNFKAEKHEGMENATDPTSPGKRMACKTILPNPSPSKKLESRRFRRLAQQHPIT